MSSGEQPIRVLLLCGGSSDEHQVSLASARSVLAAAQQAAGRLQVTPVVVSREGKVVPPQESARLLAGSSQGTHEPALAELDTLAYLSALTDSVDVVFPLLHGPNGEDGTVQGLLELMGVPYVGSGVLGSAVAMDKLTMKALFAAAGLPQVDYRALSRHAYRTDPAAVRAELAELGLPLFVKPANLGSSIGITKVAHDAELDEAIETALSFDRRVVVEAAAPQARELELAVLGNDTPEVSGVGEIVVHDGFYDYDSKYTDGRARLDIPADIPASTAAQARRLALAAFAAVDAAGLARVDLFMLADGSLLVNELNTMPGFTEHSMYPKLWAAAGVSYGALVERLVGLALEPR